MKTDNIKEISDSLVKTVTEFSTVMAKYTEKMNVLASTKSLVALRDILQTIPDDVKDTVFFRKVQALQKIDLKYDDVAWIANDYRPCYTMDSWKQLSEVEGTESGLQRYIAKIILSSSVEKREKLTVLLAHIEPLVYETLELSKGEKGNFKQKVCKKSINDNKGMSPESLGKIYVLAIVYVVFANTDNFAEEIDKRLPFRNNILHNGIVMYSNDDIDVAYNLLIDFIEILIRVREIIYQ